MHISGFIRGDDLETVIATARRIGDALGGEDLPYELEVYPRGGAPIAVLTHPRWDS